MPTPKSVWIDTDVAIGTSTPRGYNDVDDAFALLDLFAAPEAVQIRGISVVYGNTTLPNALQLGQEISERFGEGWPVAAGASAPLNLREAQPTEATEAMARALREAPMHILAVGPATNVGTLLLREPQLAGKILSVTLVAGRRGPDQHFKVGPHHHPPFPDLNFDLDPLAFQIMLEKGVPLNLAPFEVSHKVWIDSGDLDRLARLNEAGAYLATHSRAWLAQWQPFGATGFNPFDVLASSWFIDPRGFKAERLPVQFCYHRDDTRPDQPDAYKPYLVVDRRFRAAPKVLYIHTPPPDFKARLWARLARLS
ncbi:MAG: nucleoside hydrolase [Bacteroidetes bacterium]|nr:MAG: nucleoside hydrolase [Bacteroidota bacterium]